MSNPCIVTCAITGAIPTKADNPAVPVIPSEQIESTQEAYEAGDIRGLSDFAKTIITENIEEIDIT